MARPKKIIDKTKVESLAAIFCTTEEIAEVLGCSKDTLERRFAASLKKGRQAAKASLRREQWAAAKKGSVPMLIWLGKQYLNQKDRHELSNDDVKPFQLAYTLNDLKSNSDDKV
jgi:AraC-like DNA-binding protein